MVEVCLPQKHRNQVGLGRLVYEFLFLVEVCLTQKHRNTEGTEIRWAWEGLHLEPFGQNCFVSETQE